MSQRAFFAMRFVVLASLLAMTGAAIGVWVLPVEAFQHWNVTRAGADPYAQFEAAGQAEFLTWIARVLLPAMAAALVGAAVRFDWTRQWISDVVRGFRMACQVEGESAEASQRFRWRTLLLRIGVLAWLGLFAMHAIDGLFARGRDWPVYQLKSGAEVLPNISLRNRHVIRYLQQAVPEGARVLVCSDQSLFFLSYYLLPRRVFHFVHPEAEFEIPRPGQERPLAAFRLEDLTAEQIAAVRPDYVLEYFEGDSYVDPVAGVYRHRLQEDAAWNSFWRQVEHTTSAPPFLVALKPFAGETIADAAAHSAGGQP